MGAAGPGCEALSWVRVMLAEPLSGSDARSLDDWLADCTKHLFYTEHRVSASHICYGAHTHTHHTRMHAHALIHTLGAQREERERKEERKRERE